MATIDGVSVDPDWGDYKPEDWRKHPEPANVDRDDDEEETKLPPDVEMVLGVSMKDLK